MGSVLIAKVADGVATLRWDIAITPDGTLLIECNENTGHALYQLASGRAC